MNRNAVGSTLRIAALCAFSFVSTGARVFAGEWQVAPSSSFSSGYTSNPRYLPGGGVEELRSQADVGVQVNGGTERFRISLSPRASFSSYRSDRDLNTNDQYLGLSTSWQSERILWSGSGQLSRDSTQTSELGTTGLVQDNDRREWVSLSAGPRWAVTEDLSVGATIGWSDTDYLNAGATGLSDYTNSSVNLSGTLGLSERTSFSTNANAGRLESSLRDPTRNAGLSLGLTHQFTPQWTVSLTAGPSWAESRASSDISTQFAVSAQRRGEKLQFFAGASRQLDPIGTGALAQTEAVNLGFSRPLNEWISMRVSAQASRNRQLFDGELSFFDRETRYYSVIASGGWRLGPAWSLSISLEGRSQEIRNAIAYSGNADSYRASLGLAWNGGTTVL